MAKPTIHCCQHCGRDTTNKSKICRVCTGGNEHSKQYASAMTDSRTEWAGEADYDYSEESLGPKQAEDRLSAVYNEDWNEWRKSD